MINHKFIEKNTKRFQRDESERNIQAKQSPSKVKTNRVFIILNGDKNGKNKNKNGNVNGNKGWGNSNGEKMCLDGSIQN